MAQKTLTLTKVVNPFNRTDRDILVYEYQNEPLSVICSKSLPDDLEFDISLNGHVIPKQHLSLVTPKPGDSIVFSPVIAGGDTGKTIGRIVGMIIVTAAAMYAGQGWAAAGLWGGAFGGAIAAGAIAIVGGILVNAVFAPSPPSAAALGPGDNAISNAYGWEPSLQQKQGICIPRWYGRNKINGNVISAYIDSDGTKQYKSMLISLGFGPMGIEETTDDNSLAEKIPANVEINGHTYTDYVDENNKGVSLYYRRGDLRQTSIPFFQSINLDDNNLRVNPVKVESSSVFTYTTPADDFNALEVEISCPALWWVAAKTGFAMPATIQFAIDYRKHGTTDPWVPFTGIKGRQPIASAKQGAWGIGWSPAPNRFGVTVNDITVCDPGLHHPGDTAGASVNTQGEPNQAGYDFEICKLIWGVPDPLAFHEYTPVWCWKEVGSGGHTFFEMSANEKIPVRQVFTTDVPERGALYDIRVTRLVPHNPVGWPAENTNTYMMYNDMYVSNVRTVTSTNLTYPKQALIGVRALADSSNSNSIDFSVITNGRYVRVWDGAQWTAATSNNPAWVLWDVLTQPVFDTEYHNPRLEGGIGTPYYVNTFTVLRYDGIDPSRLDLNKFLELANWCDALVPDGNGGTEKRMTFNGGFDAETTLWDAAQQVCQIAGCSLIPTGSGYTLAIEKPGDMVQIFSVGNTEEDSFKETFLPMEDRASEITVDYRDATLNYDRTTITIVNSELKTVANKVSIQALGVTKASEAWRLAERQLRVNQLILRTLEWKADIDAIACGVGDVVGLQSDVPQWGFGGRIVSATANTVKLDRQVTIEAGKSYGLLVRLIDDTIVTRTVTTGPGITDELTVSANFNPLPQQYDIYSFGLLGLETKLVRVSKIKRDGDLKALITAMEYNASVYDDSGAPPVPTPNPSLLDTFVKIINLTLTEDAHYEEGGVFRRDIIAGWALDINSAVIKDIEVYVREQGLPWQLAGTTTDSGFIIKAVKPTTTYDVMVVGVNAGGIRTPYALCPVGTITTGAATSGGGGGGSILDVVLTGLAFEFGGSDCNISWDAPTSTDAVNHYQVDIFPIGTTITESSVPIRSESTQTNGYVYTFGKNYDDHTHIPVPQFIARVAAVDVAGAKSDSVQIDCINPVPDPATGITTFPRLLSVALEFDFIPPLDFDCVEIWMTPTGVLANASLLATTKENSFIHTGLGAVVVNYYWIRIKDIFNQYSTYYPTGTGVQGSTLTDPTQIIKHLNDDVTSQAAEDYLNGDKPLLMTLDTQQIIFGDTVVDAEGYANYTQHIYQNSRDLLLIGARVDLIAMKAPGDQDWAEIAMVPDLIGIKLHSDGGHTAGVVINWMDDLHEDGSTHVPGDGTPPTKSSHTKSNITVRADTFLLEKEGSSLLNAGDTILKDHYYVIMSRQTLDFTTVGGASNTVGDEFKATANATLGTGDQVKEIIHVFMVGMVDGQQTVGINGNLIIDGTVTASAMSADIFVGLDFILGNGVDYGKLETFNFDNKATGVRIQDGVTPTVIVKGGSIFGSTITGSTIRTNPDSNGYGITLDSATNTLKIKDENGIDIISMGGWNASVIGITVNNGDAPVVPGVTFSWGGHFIAPDAPNCYGLVTNAYVGVAAQGLHLDFACQRSGVIDLGRAGLINPPALADYTDVVGSLFCHAGDGLFYSYNGHWYKLNATLYS